MSTEHDTTTNRPEPYVPVVAHCLDGGNGHKHRRGAQVQARQRDGHGATARVQKQTLIIVSYKNG